MTTHALSGRCLLCQAQRMTLTTTKGWATVRCSACGSTWGHPDPAMAKAGAGLAGHRRYATTDPSGVGAIDGVAESLAGDGGGL